MKGAVGGSRASPAAWAQEVVVKRRSLFAPRNSYKMGFSSLGKFWQPRICFYQNQFRNTKTSHF